MLLADTDQLRAQPAGGGRTVVVIGAGAIGLYVASELAKRGLTVILIEAGGTHLGSFPAGSYRSIGRKHSGIEIGRSRSIGGTTNLWGGQLVEFQPVDFQERDWLRQSRWPVSYEEILPYYRATYEAFGIPEEMQDDDQVWRLVGGRRPALSDEFEVFLTRWLKVPSFAVHFGDVIERSPRLLVLANHVAVGFEGTGGRIERVRVAGPSGKIERIEGDCFIIAAGTIETSRLLLHAARADDWTCPWRDNDNVGAFFQDHLGGRIGRVKPRDARAFFDTFSTLVISGQKFQPKFRLRSDVLLRERMLGIHGIFAFESSVTENLVYLKQFVKAALYSRRVSGVRDLVRNAAACWKYLLPLAWRFIYDHRIFVPRTSAVSLMVQAEQVPCRDSRIRIDPHVHDTTGLPAVVLDWKVSQEELAGLRDFALRAQRALAEAGLADLEIDPALLALDAQFLQTLQDTYHQAGGAVMGNSPADGVVDADCRVFGTNNLYVGGAAVFPTSSSANVTFTALAFATRLVHHLAQHYAAVADHSADPVPAAC